MKGPYDESGSTNVEPDYEESLAGLDEVFSDVSENNEEMLELLLKSEKKVEAKKGNWNPEKAFESH